MSFFKKIFGKKKSLNKSAGIHSEPVQFDDSMEWGELKLLGARVKDLAPFSVNDKDIEMILSAAEHQSQIEKESNEALSEQYANADLEYIKWQDHFKLEGISILENELVLTFEDKTNYYHFNVYFENNLQVGVSIDA